MYIVTYSGSMKAPDPHWISPSPAAVWETGLSCSENDVDSSCDDPDGEAEMSEEWGESEDIELDTDKSS